MGLETLLWNGDDYQLAQPNHALGTGVFLFSPCPVGRPVVAWLRRPPGGSHDDVARCGAEFPPLFPMSNRPAEGEAPCITEWPCAQARGIVQMCGAQGW